MAIPKETLWPLEPHTLGKHRVLKSYPDAWLPIMGKRNGRILFISCKGELPKASSTGSKPNLTTRASMVPAASGPAQRPVHRIAPRKESPLP